MTEIKDKILAWPSKPPPQLEEGLRQLSKYDSLIKAPFKLLAELIEELKSEKVIAVWGQKGHNSLDATYSIEDRPFAEITHLAHKQDYRAYNPKLMRFYTRQDLINIVKNNY